MDGSTTWVDEFVAPPGSAPDLAVWVPDVGDGGWGDDQLQRYTVPPENAFVTAAGQLAVVARRTPSPVRGDGGVTSARLVTKDRLTVLHGRIEARIKVPRGPGLWPAFWMLGADVDEVGWPACGEIDVMEHVGSEPHTVHGTLHGPGYCGLGDTAGDSAGENGCRRGGAGRSFTVAAPLADDFHVYGVDWEPEAVTWLLDDRPYARLTPDDVPGPWPFRHPFHLLLNLAVGGRWPGNRLHPDTLPATMLVDWVRIRSEQVDVVRTLD